MPRSRLAPSVLSKDANAARVGRNNRRALRRMLIVIHHATLFTTSPIERIHALFDQMMKGRITPVAHPLHQDMIDRVIVHVIHMSAKVCLAANELLPISPLPYAPLATFSPHQRASFLHKQKKRENQQDQPR